MKRNGDNAKNKENVNKILRDKKSIAVKQQDAINKECSENYCMEIITMITKINVFNSTFRRNTKSNLQKVE